jgi:hypothetical protein
MRRGRIAGSLGREEATEQRVMEIATLGERQSPQPNPSITTL